ncbi:MAG TPA: formyltransferase family protein [Gemmatimonadaceae bacterium]
MSAVRVAFLTGNERRHRYAAAVLARAVDLAGVISEAKISPRESAASLPPEDREVIERHLAERDEVERRLLGEAGFPGAPLLSIERGAINGPEVASWLERLEPELLVLFGTSIVGEQLLSRFADRVVNVHLGLSPYYRGSGTNFWPLVRREPECVGATVHLAVTKVDAGAILGQVRPHVERSDRAHELGTRAIMEAFGVLPTLLETYARGELEPREPRSASGELFRRADFCATAVQHLWRQLETGMIPEYLRDRARRCAAYPIVEALA